MPGRRYQPDPFEKVDEPRWLVVRDRHSRAVAFTELPPRCDLKGILTAERVRWVNRGWQASKLSRYSFIFCEHGNDRVCVSIECFEPVLQVVASAAS